ncbi:MAG TPA: hypothetical protein VLT16_14140 [Candidatus Limnocylindrales bacterium]|nr:hypothetical protein [Candidatus Limnocylindrales bacterium]
MAAGNITFIECPYGDTFPVRKTARRSCGIQEITCPECGHTFDVMLEESVERLSDQTPQKAPGSKQPIWRGAAATASFV